jgi:hypothetical protein
MTEKTAAADGRVDSGKLLESARDSAKVFVHDDFAQIAARNSSVISAALFGALAGANVLPFNRDAFEKAIQRGGVGIAASLAAFSDGFASAQGNTTPVVMEDSKPRLGWQIIRTNITRRNILICSHRLRTQMRNMDLVMQGCYAKRRAISRCGCPMKMQREWLI